MELAISLSIIGLGVLALIFFLCEKIRQYSVKATLIKAATSILFVILATFCTFYKHTSPLGFFVIVGLSFGMLGDVWLDLKYAYPKEQRNFTFAGFICFLIGHIFYISGMFVTYRPDHPLYFVLPFVFGIVCAGLVIFLEKPLKLKYGEMKVMSLLYALALFSMVGTAISMVVFTSGRGVTADMLLAGGVLFAVSDLILSGTYFGVDKERPVDLISNAVTYYMAQYIIAFSIFFI